MVSVEYRFTGRTAHAAMDPWEGRSALDAVEVMSAAWDLRREHLPITHRSHYVRSEEHTSELQSLMRISYAVFCLQKKITIQAPTECYLLHTIIATLTIQ